MPRRNVGRRGAYRDKERVRCLYRAGIEPGERIVIRQSFSFISNREGAFAAASELKRLGWTDLRMVEEISGDGFWHVLAGRRQRLSERIVAENRATAERIARQNLGTYDGWSARG